MSYLDIPNLHFSGKFFSNPSTINNKLANFNPDVKLIPIDDIPFGVQSDLSAYTGFPYVNPTGQGLFYFVNCFVRGGSDVSGNPVNSIAYPEILGASVTTIFPPAKMVDIDPDQQSISQIHGLQIKVTFGNNTGFYGPLETSSLTDLWYGRVPSCPGDSGASGFFQTIMPADKITWFNLEHSLFLQTLKEKVSKGLSIKWMLDAYQGQKRHPDFNKGRIVGTIGPAFENEPTRFPAGRRLKNNGAKFGNAFYKIDLEHKKIRIDLSNCIPLENPAGAAINYGLMQSAILVGSELHFLPGFIDYSRNNLENNAGIFEMPVTETAIQLLDQYPLGIVINKPPEGTFLVMREDSSLKWINFDQSWLRLSPNETAVIPFFARKGNHPAAQEEVSFHITDSQVNNKPRSGITIQTVQTTDEHGLGYLRILSNSPSPLPPRRAVIDSQLYYVGGPWQAYGGFYAQSGGGALTILLFNDFLWPSYINWEDHIEPIFSMYARIYPGIINKDFNFADLQEIKKHAAIIRKKLSLPVESAEYIFVNRDIAPEKIRMIVKWIDNGLPQSLNDAMELDKRQSSLDNTIETPHLLLKQYNAEDASKLLTGIMENKKHLESTLHPRVAGLTNIHEAKTLILSLKTDWQNRVRMIIPIYLKENNILAGELFVGNFDWQRNEAEIGYFLFKQYEGKGIAYEAAIALIPYLFHDMKLTNVICRCDEDNTRSIKLARKLGFIAAQKNNTVRTKPDNTSVPILIFNLTYDCFSTATTR